MNRAVAGRLATLAARRGAVGAQYLVTRGPETWLEISHGLADASEGRAVTPLTIFNAYSITKPFTAAAALALAAAGHLDLDAPIGAAAGVAGLNHYGTVRETLLHRAGFRNPNPLRWIHASEGHESFDEAAFVRTRMSELSGTRRRLARSGYSNLGYLLLGLAIERAWGGSFTHAMQALVLDRIGLRADESVGFAAVPPESEARGHLPRLGLLNLMLGLFLDRASLVQDQQGEWVRLKSHRVDGSAYGGLLANVRGLARFARALLQSPSPLQGVPSLMFEPVSGPGPTRTLGWFTGRLGGHPWLAHAGGGLGAYGELRIYPTLDRVSVLLTNGAGLRDARCLDHLDALWLKIGNLGA